MFDLASSMNLPVNEEKKLALILFYQTEKFRELMEEVFRFEGITAPIVFKYSDDAIRDNAQEFTDHIIMIELNESTNITTDIEQISHQLPHSASVIVVGSENSISTIRSLRAMGYYYLFWPITKLELIDFIKGVNDDFTKNNQISKSRQAKRIVVLGSKGGVGTSMLTAEISKELSERRNSSCMVIDHNFSGGNLDIMLGLKQFARRKLAPGMLVSNLDPEYAEGMTTKVNDMLSLLAIESDNLSVEECREYIHVLTNQLALQTNFIIEDLSGSASEKIHFLTKETDIDVVVLVIDQTVSSLREASRVLSSVKEKKLAMRFIIVVNNTKPEKYSTVDLKDIKKHIGKNVDVICPFEPKIGSALLLGESVFSKNMPISLSLNSITALLLGETLKRPSLFKRLTQRMSL
ncbi:AAA family ATPase [Aliivibrio sifiae]|uniref:Chromosome partitioning ATPase n=1 Tax=Aliivibrio sifiae TaxID=566293 RepID=A0A2S7X8U7_9GAMM|nr:chromosome partitioning protein ParA [Aliivibrio sifiae]PQJ87759.1 chromosome partitioning protein ParA [Aliivibrio sifiae]GLR73391.1 chromosome partitioning ATPase [Aliivibrio sifiae]